VRTYRAGTLSLTAASTTIVGVGTQFLANVAIGDVIVVENGQCFETVAVPDDTHITVDTPAKATGPFSYAALRFVTAVNFRDLSVKIEQFLTDRQVNLAEFTTWMTGSRTGGPTSNGYYPLTDRFGVTKQYMSPETIAYGYADSIDQATAAAASAAAALTSKNSANSSEANAGTSAAAALASKNAAASSETNALASKNAAATSATAAAGSATSSDASATSSLSGRDSSQAFAVNSLAAAANAQTLQIQAQQSALDAQAAALYNLPTWAYSQAFRLASATRDANGAITTANIVWPDGVSGVFTTDAASTTFLGAVDAWHATYVGVTTKTITQPAVTRDANGGIVAQPAITIA